MRLLLLLLVVTCWAAPVRAQFQTQVYAFPEYGFQIPFFQKVTRTLHAAGTPQERIEYALADSSHGKLYAFLQIFTQAGCLPVDTFYRQASQYVTHHASGAPFRILDAQGNTYPFGWTGYFATAAIDGPYPGNFVATRDFQAFLNGQVLFIVDIISQGYNFSDVVKPILDDPGYHSILLPHELTELNIRLFTRGNVASHYDPHTHTYYLGRCDRLGTVYPHATLARLDSDPASESLQLMGQLRLRDDVRDTQVETLAPQGPLSRLSGTVYRVSYHEATPDGEGQVIHYLFTFEGSAYRASLFVPFGPDDNHVYGYQDNAIDAEDAARFDERLQAILGTLERIK